MNSIDRRIGALQHAARLLESGAIPERSSIHSGISDDAPAVQVTVYGKAWNLEGFVTEVAEIDRQLGTTHGIVWSDEGQPTAVWSFPTGLRIKLESFMRAEKVQVGERTEPVFEYRLPEIDAAETAAA